MSSESPAQPDHRRGISAEDLDLIQRRMRLENGFELTIVIALPAGAAAFLAAYYGGFRVLSVPIILLTIGVGLIATVGWVVSYFRTDRAFARVETNHHLRRRVAFWRYVVPIVIALGYGAAFFVWPRYERLLWHGFFGVGVAFALVRQIQRIRDAGQRRRRTSRR